MEIKDCSLPFVCFFDSGIGGLTVLSECVRKLPNVRFAYFADNYKVPYGNLSREKLIALVNDKFEQIKEKNPSAAVVACNTVTAECIDTLRKKFSFPIVGIQPAIKQATEVAGQCVVLSTPLTARSNAIKKLLDEWGYGRTKIIACPSLAQYIENNIFSLSEHEIFSLLPVTDADSLVLGCTHYIFIKKIVQKFYGCPVFDGVDGIVKRLGNLLKTEININRNARDISFIGGDAKKNSAVFNMLFNSGG